MQCRVQNAAFLLVCGFLNCIFIFIFSFCLSERWMFHVFWCPSHCPMWIGNCSHANYNLNNIDVQHYHSQNGSKPTNDVNTDILNAAEFNQDLNLCVECGMIHFSITKSILHFQSSIWLHWRFNFYYWFYF